MTVSLGGRSFTITLEAYNLLDSYLKAFKSKISPNYQADDVMVEIEERVSDIFYESTIYNRQVIDIEIVHKVINQLGMPDGSTPNMENNTTYKGTWTKDTYSNPTTPPVHKFYRDSDDKKIAGVCSGIAAYFNIDTLLVRVLAFVLLCCGSFGFWVYIVLWIIAPEAVTPLQKCELRGLAPTAENLRRFTKS